MRKRVRWMAAGIWLAAAVWSGSGAAGEAVAQLPVKAWVRPLAAVPLGSFGGRDDGIEARPGFGFDAGSAVTLGALTLYGEYQQIAFGCGECDEVGVEETVLDRGWGVGVMIPYPSTLAGFQPWGRLGVVGHQLRFRYAEEEAYSDPALGWAIGFGAEARPIRWLRVEPSLLLRSYDASYGFMIDVPDRDSSVSYITLGLGIGVGL